MLELTLVVPFYKNCSMLKAQMHEWEEFPGNFRFIVVDDGSPEAALDIVEANASQALRDCLKLYRVKEDISWNRGGARNLGSKVADTDWIIHIDIDHILPADAAFALTKFSPEPRRWYRFPRYRIGAADETRNKDKLPRECEFGAIKPHCDSYMVESERFDKWFYDEDYSGCLGGGSPFLHNLEAIAGPPLTLPEPIRLHVHTRNSIPDSSDMSLSRDTSEYSRRRKDKERRGDTVPKNPLRFAWERVL
jgi:glycosyltransferase involved in cell wall biosynthesis